MKKLTVVKVEVVGINNLINISEGPIPHNTLSTTIISGKIMNQARYISISRNANWLQMGISSQEREERRRMGSIIDAITKIMM